LTVKLLPILTQILTTNKNDPTVVSELALKLLKPVSFTQALTLASEDVLVQALQSPSPSTNILAIAVLEKAARAPGDTAILSVMRRVVGTFLRTWLSTPHVEVGERATKALGDLLSMDSDHRRAATYDSMMHGMEISSQTPPGQGLLWRRLFHDREIYHSLFDLCSFKTAGTGEGLLDVRQKSLAEARLLQILPRLVALNFKAVTTTNFPDIEQQFGMREGEDGILWFAATDMVNKEEDMLMHIMVIDFFPALLKVMSTGWGIPEQTGEYAYVKRLVKKVTATDIVVRKTLEAMEMDLDSPYALVSWLRFLRDVRIDDGRGDY
jgi:hypothetical protein